jgi:hypothetical protein
MGEFWVVGQTVVARAVGRAANEIYKGIKFTMPDVLWTLFLDNPPLANALLDPPTCDRKTGRRT